jgi:hypothetical protein
LRKQTFSRVGEWNAVPKIVESFMIRRKIWLHYRAIRLTIELITTIGSATVIGYWIVQASR